MVQSQLYLYVKTMISCNMTKEEYAIYKKLVDMSKVHKTHDTVVSH